MMAVFGRTLLLRNLIRFLLGLQFVFPMNVHVTSEGLGVSEPSLAKRALVGPADSGGGGVIAVVGFLRSTAAIGLVA